MDNGNGKHVSRNYHLDADVIKLMQEIKDREGIQFNFMVNTALRLWLLNRKAEHFQTQETP